MLLSALRLQNSETGLNKVIDPNAPPVWAQKWYDTKQSSVNRANRSNLAHISGFRHASMRVGNIMAIDFRRADINPRTPDLDLL